MSDEGGNRSQGTHCEAGVAGLRDAHHKWWATGRMIQLITAVAVLMQLEGCAARWKMLPVEGEQAVTMFDAHYRLSIHGFGAFHHSSISRMAMSVSPAFAPSDSSGVAGDKLPIFVMDSVCFAGDCLDPEFCRRSLEPIEKYMRRDPDGGISFEGLDHDDAYRFRWDHELIWPGEIFRGDDVRVPLVCEGESVWLMLYARLVDRRTGETIARETKRVPCKVTRSKVWFTHG